MRGEEGYTLAECLVALFVLGLAIAGLSAGVTAIGRQEASARRLALADRTARQAQAMLGGLLEGEGPFTHVPHSPTLTFAAPYVLLLFLK
jgi:prepilin-type N-terminal cleavage/methylation domain-containing protein